MTCPDGRGDCHCAMELIDIATADRYRVSQLLGRGSNACRADAAGFAQASMVLRRALSEPLGAIDFVVSNRFGVLEVDGGGFAAELIELMASGVPGLTVVSPRYQGAWQRFTGGALVLPADAEAVQGWIAAALAAKGDPAWAVK